jgi:DNA (cytosine-5)-methyltransferase 1
MWRHMARIIGEVRPRYVFVENSPALITRGLGVVLGDLAALRYDCRWTVLGASDVGAPHQRDRFWLVAHANSLRELQPQGSISDQRGRVGDGSQPLADADCALSQGGGGIP